MARNTPTITHVEILCKAIQCYESEIAELQRKCEGKTDDPMVKSIVDSYIAERTPKIEALKRMYFFETGTEHS